LVVGYRTRCEKLTKQTKIQPKKLQVKKTKTGTTVSIFKIIENYYHSILVPVARTLFQCTNPRLAWKQSGQFSVSNAEITTDMYVIFLNFKSTGHLNKELTAAGASSHHESCMMAHLKLMDLSL
jgi:hypothetical protein